MKTLPNEQRGFGTVPPLKIHQNPQPQGIRVVGVSAQELIQVMTRLAGGTTEPQQVCPQQDQMGLFGVMFQQGLKHLLGCVEAFPRQQTFEQPSMLVLR